MLAAWSSLLIARRKFSMFITLQSTFTSDFNVAPDWSIENIGTKAIVPGSVDFTFGNKDVIDLTPSNSTLGANNGVLTYVEIPQGGPNARLRYGMVHYGLGIINFGKGGYDASIGFTQEFNFNTVDLISGDDLSFSGGSATIQLPEGESIKPGSVRFIANLDITSKLVVTASSLHPYDTQEPSPITTQKQIFIYDVPEFIGIGEFGANEFGFIGKLCFTLVPFDHVYGVGEIYYDTGQISISYSTLFLPDDTPRQAHMFPETLADAHGDTVHQPLYYTNEGPSFYITRTLANGVITNKLFTWDKTPFSWRFRQFSIAQSQTVTGVKYALSSAVETPITYVHTVASIPTLNIPVPPSSSLEEVTFTLGSTPYVTQGTDIVANPDPSTGVGTVVGSIEPATGIVTLPEVTISSPTTVENLTVAIAPPASSATCHKITIRTASAPLRPGSFSVSWTSPNPSPVGADTSHTATADLDGYINTPYVIGIIDYARGVVQLWFTTNYIRPIGGDFPLSDFSSLGIPGVTTRKSWMAYTVSLRYNTVAYSYLPLDATLLGIEPVRLPSDGRVPIFRPGGFVVVGHTGEITATVSNTQVIDCARVRLSRVRVIGDDGAVINTGYTADLEAGTVTFTDVSGYSQPVTIQHRIEDMMMTSDVQINGQLTFTRALTHDYPLGSYVSSALIAPGNGDMFARVSVLFDQATWNGTYQDTISGSPATGTFNSAQYPIVVTNRGARTERWAVQFTSGTTFNVIGENVGVIATGSVNSNCLPINPATNVPYFTIPALGWGAGWSAGNVLRFNTVGAEFPVWVVRTVQQGPETVPDDSFTLLIRGDVNTP